MSRVINIGILGYAHLHAPRFAASIADHNQVRFMGIADAGVNASAARDAAEHHGTAFFDTYDELLDQDDLDAVYLGNEPVHHRDVVEKAARRGVHVLCDKPIATTLEDADAIIESARAGGIKLMVSFFPRFQLPLMKVKEALDSGDAGDLVAIYAVKYGRLPTKAVGPQSADWFLDPTLTGGGGFLDIGIHAMDALRWLAGAEASRVYAHVGTMIHEDLDVEDFGVATIEFDNGVIGALTAGWANPDGYPAWLDVKFEILTTKQVFLIDKPHHDFALYTNNGSERQAWLRLDVDELLTAFVEAIVAGHEPPITGQDGRAALAMTLAAYESSRTGNAIKLLQDTESLGMDDA
ncbi:MAG: Gfo/Idh/MocA family protein [Acidimicrobiia bacterium]